MKFRNMISLKDAGDYDDFSVALKDLITKVIETAKTGAPQQFIETCVMVLVDNNGNEIPMGFFDVRDLGYELGVLRGEGEFVDPPPELDNKVIVQKFRENLLGGLQAELSKMAGFFTRLANETDAMASIVVGQLRREPGMEARADELEKIRLELKEEARRLNQAL